MEQDDEHENPEKHSKSEIRKPNKSIRNYLKPTSLQVDSQEKVDNQDRAKIRENA